MQYLLHYVLVSFNVKNLLLLTIVQFVDIKMH